MITTTKRVINNNCCKCYAVKPFHTTCLFLYSLKKNPENLWFSDIFRGFRKSCQLKG